MKLKMY